MTIPHYGVWVGIPTRYKAETEKDDSRSPHLELYFKDDESGKKERRAAINVKSLDSDTRLVYWHVPNFTHAVTKELEKLPLGFELLPSKDKKNPVPGLDYLRMSDLIGGVEKGQILPHDIPGPDNDILDKMRTVLDEAIGKKSGGKSLAHVYLFGSSFGSGIHDVHMNQGSKPNFENGVGQDGALLVHFGDGHWEAIFLAFASQKVPTNDKTGLPLGNSKTLVEVIGDKEQDV